MKAIKKTIAMTVLSALLFTGFAFAVPTTVSAAYDNNVTFTIDGTNSSLPGYDHSNVYLFPNTGSSAKTISYKSYNFRYSKLMIFNSSGRVVECGGNLYDGSSSVTGAPQVSVTIPAGGFMVAFGANNTKFMNIYNVVMEGAMLYNATMSVIYEAYASYSGSTLTVRYNNPKPASSNAISFLFVGNSTTYFNGTPIKFKAMAAAAGIEIDVVYCTFGSAFLSEFSNPNHERGKALRNHLASRKFDYVVLQDAAGRDYNTTKPEVEKILPLIEANGAEALLYMRYSAASTVDQIRTNAIKHHNNYATLAKDYNLVCAPSADAFVHYAEKYNDPYTLYASDGGHHSKEGSYLIAATWLYSYLGVNPVGNTYTADLSSSMVQKLQECAKIACEEGYPYPGMDNDYQEDGVYYKNVAKGKKYTVNGTAYSGNWTDANTDGTPIGKLTDGTISTNGGDTSSGCWKGTSVDITINLEGVFNIKNIRIDLHGNEGWGVGDPSKHTVKAAVSMDGTNFTDIGTATMGNEIVDGNWKAREFNLKTGDNINAKYVKLTLSNAANSFFWSSEIRIYGNESNNVANDANIALNKTYTASGIYSNNGSIPYPDEDGKSMTNGIIGTSTSVYSDPAYAGFNKGTSDYIPNGYASITVDLGKVYDLEKFVAFVATSYDKNGAAGISAPASMSIYVSNDNANWTKAGEANFKDDSSKGCEALEITAKTGATGRYVQYRFVANKNWMMIAEVEAYGTVSSSQPVDPNPNPDPDQPDPDQPVDNPYQPIAKPSLDENNVASGKGYVASEIFAGYDGTVQYPDENGKTMTDGMIAPDNATFNNEAFIGFNNNCDYYEANGYFAITVDLEKTYNLDRFVTYVATSFNEHAGLAFPETVSVYVSNDNSTWIKAGSTNPTDVTDVACLAIEIKADTAVSGRYVQFRYENAEDWVMVAEVEAYATEESADVMLGDVNNDKKVDSVDYLLVKRACFKTYELDADEFARADVNGDKVMDSTDYLLVKRIAFGTYKA